jgi:hypothetical protein
MPARIYGQLKRYNVEDPAKILEELAFEIRSGNHNGSSFDSENMEQYVFDSFAKKFNIDKMEIYLRD